MPRAKVLGNYESKCVVSIITIITVISVSDITRVVYMYKSWIQARVYGFLMSLASTYELMMGVV